jgi:tetratricopeptide (TPR) repeat protein
MKRLEEKIQGRIERLCDTGDMFAKNGYFPAALKNYWTAYDLLPEPKEEWVAGTWILAAIGDTNFLKKDFQAGADNLEVAMLFPNALENPFLHLRLGQCYFELGYPEKASQELFKAYFLEGEEIFSQEESKYFYLLKSRLLMEELS